MNRCKEWVRRSGNIELLTIDSSKLCTSRHICGLHFGDEQYANKYRNTLLKTPLQYPTKELPSPLPEQEMAKFPVTVTTIQGKQKIQYCTFNDKM